MLPATGSSGLVLFTARGFDGHPSGSGESGGSTAAATGTDLISVAASGGGVMGAEVEAKGAWSTGEASATGCGIAAADGAA